jgi:PAS domain S-box-containing protein
MRLSLTFKILIPALALALIGALCLFAWQYKVQQQREVDALRDRMHTFLATQAVQLSEAIWTFNRDNVERLIHSFETNSDLLEVVLYDADGIAVARAHGLDAEGYSRTFASSAVLTHAASGEVFTLGRLEVVYHDGRLRAEASSRLETGLRILAFMVLILSAACALVFHFLIGIPLARLKKSLDRNARDSLHEPLSWTSNDELGDVVVSYNSMLSEIKANTDDLKLAGKVFENTMESIVVTDPNGVIERVNPAFTAITGYLPKEMIGQNIMTLNANQHSDIFFKEIWQTLQWHSHWSGALWNRRKDGEVYPEWATISAIKDQQGGHAHYISISRDITELKQAEEALIQAKNAAESANKTKSEFLANMSHEIRTPLNGILGMLQLMGETSLDGEQSEYLLNAITSSKRLAKLLSDILDLSRIEANKLVIHEGVFTVASLTQSVMELFSITAKEKGLTLEFFVDAHVPQQLIGDEVRLRQILINLTGNAIKFTEKGHVKVEMFPLYCTGNTTDRVLFTISDTGVGIPDAMLKEIFQPFTQVEGSYSRRFQGAGLGLSIVRKLVALMGGELSIDNTEGAGTTIYLTLPFKLPNDQVQAAQPVLPIAPPANKPLRILFAEDDNICLFAGVRMLERLGHTVITARDGQEALHMLAEQDFDLILMDIQMPLMDGVEATRAIRTQPRFGTKAQIPIIAMTAYAMAGDREKLLATGMNDYIAKPVGKRDLQRVIERVMSKATITTT